MSRCFWLAVALFGHLQPYLPNKPRGVPRVDDRCVVSGFSYVIRKGLMWRDAPSKYGLHKTLCNRFVRWSEIFGFDRILSELSAASTAIDIR